MTQRWWYLRRAVPWGALLGCCAGAVITTLLLEQWPSSALVLLPALLACCAAAATFCFDESALPVIEVTPRGAAWRRGARLGAVCVPAAVWVAVGWVRPGDLPLDRSAWLLVGAGAIALAAGAAALASRRSVPSPGAVLAPVVALGTLAPLVVGVFLGLDSVYPVDELTTRAQAFWVGVGAAGVAAGGSALRPGMRH